MSSGIFRILLISISEKAPTQQVDNPRLVISNNKLLKIIDEKTTVSSAFLICDDVLGQAVQGITDLILVPGIINIDFADFRTILTRSTGV